MPILWIFALGGVACCMVFCWCKLLIPKNRSCLHLLFLEEAQCENIEQLLRWCCGLLCWDFWLGRGRLLVVRQTLTAPQERILQYYTRRYYFLQVCTPQQLDDLLEGEAFSQIHLILN